MHMQGNAPKDFFSQPHIPVFLFLFFGSLFGTLCLLRPPFQSHNASEHFYRAYDPFAMHEVEVPLDAQDFVQGFEHFYVTDTKLEPQLYFERLKKGNLTRTGATRIKLTELSANSALPYVPATSGIRIVEFFNGNSAQAYLLGSVINLLVFLTCMAAAVRTIPTGKYALAGLGLTPVLVGEAATTSPEAIGLGFAFLFVAYLLELRLTTELLTPRALVYLLTLCMVVSVCEPLFVCIFPLFFLVPRERFGGSFTRVYTFGLFMAAAFLSMRQFVIFSGSERLGGNLSGQSHSFFERLLHYIGTNLSQDVISSIGTFSFYATSKTYLFSLPGWTLALWALLLGLLCWIEAPVARFRLSERALIVCCMLAYFPLLVIVPYLSATPLKDSESVSLSLHLIPLYVLLVIVLLGIRRHAMRWGGLVCALALICQALLVGFFGVKYTKTLWENPSRMEPSVMEEVTAPQAANARAEATIENLLYFPSTKYLFVRGWSVQILDNRKLGGASSLVLFGEDKTYWGSLSAETRTDVNKNSGISDARELGFRDMFDLSKIRPGRYQLGVMVKSAFGEALIKTEEYVELPA